MKAIPFKSIIRAARLTVTLYFVFFVIQRGNAQEVDTANVPVWVDMMNDPNANFFETQKAFNKYWSGRDISGAGYKQFKRWEQITKNRINSAGQIEAPGTQDREIEKWSKSYYNDGLSRRSGNKQMEGRLGAWKQIGPIYGNGNLGRINDIAFHPTDSNIIYAGAPSGGLWKTTNGGEFWIPITDGLPTLGVSAIIVDPKNPNIIYIGTGDRDANDALGMAIYKSTDAGKTFKKSSTGMLDCTVNKLLMDPNNSNVLLAATSIGIFKSSNAGGSWTKKTNQTVFEDMQNCPNNFKYIYASQNGKYYRSKDSGETFQKIDIVSGSPFLRRGAFAVSSSKPNIAYYIATTATNLIGVYKSTDTGSSYTLQANTPDLMARDPSPSQGNLGQAFYNLSIAANPNNADEVFVGGIYMYRSGDAGKTWKREGYSMHHDHHVIKYEALTKKIFSGSDGGVYKRNPSKDDWVSYSNGLAITQVYRVGTCNSSNMILSGSQDNGSLSFRGRGTYNNEGGGDGMSCAVDKTDISQLYVSTQNGTIVRKGFGYNNAIISTFGEKSTWITPFILKEGRQNTMIAGFKHIWVSKNVDTDSAHDITWEKVNYLNGSPIVQLIEHLENNPADDKILYVSDNDGGFFRTDNINSIGAFWTDLSLKLPVKGKDIQAIESDYFNDDDVYISLNRKVYKSVNKGFSWTDISNGLPNVEIYSLVMDSSKKDGSMYAGTYAGVFYRNNTLNAWVPFSQNLPRALWITDLGIIYGPNPANHRLVAGTYGRGVWETPLYDFKSNLPESITNAERLISCASQQIKFHNSSNYVGKNQWKVTPNTDWEFTDGTNDSSQRVVIQFNKAGDYTITHIASNCNGIDSSTSKVHIIGSGTGAYCKTTSTKEKDFLALGKGVWKVKFHTLNNTSYSTFTGGGYEDFTCYNIQHLHPDSTYPLTVESMARNGEYCKAYVDFNRDGDFTDPNEEILNSSLKKVHNGTLKFPIYAVANVPLRLRIISNLDPITGPCMQMEVGQSEDYTIILHRPVDFSISKTKTCRFDTIEFSNQSIIDANTFVWDFGVDAIPKTAVGQGPYKVVYSSAGSKKVKLTLNDSTFIEHSLVIEDSLDASFTFSTVGAPDKVEFLPNNTGWDEYQWNFGDNSAFSNQTSPTHTYLKDGKYKVLLEVANGFCRDSSSKWVNILPNAVKYVSGGVGAILYPNPASHLIVVEFEEAQKITGINMFDPLGKKVFDQTMENHLRFDGKKVFIDISDLHLSSGNYVLRLTTVDSRDFTFKLSLNHKE